MATAHAGRFRLEDVFLDADADPNNGPSVLHACCDWHFEHLIRSISWSPEVEKSTVSTIAEQRRDAHMRFGLLLGRKADPPLRTTAEPQRTTCWVV